MKKIFLIVFFGLLLNILAYSQSNEYMYMALKFGASHGFSPAPAMNVYKYLYDPDDNEMQLTPTGSAYAPGFVADFLYHFDFTGDNAGIITGLEYNFGGMGANYKTQFGGHTMKEIYRYHSLGVPLAFKYGPKFWNNQRYIYAGVQLNYILAMKSVQTAEWQTTPSSKKLLPEEYKKLGINLFFGLNFSAFNLQLDFYPNTFFNKKYIYVANGEELKIHEGEPDQLFAIKTSINIPYGWLSDKSFWWRKILRGTIWK